MHRAWWRRGGGELWRFCAWLVAGLILLGLACYGQAHAKEAHAGTGQGCRASWYAQGHRTAAGEAYRPDGLTAAHRTLPFGTLLAVAYRGRTVLVRVNDRGPAAWTGRCLDLSRGAARALGLIGAGVGQVTFRVARR